MTHTEELTEFVQAWEGLRLRAYRDGGGVPTIGWGHTAFVEMGDTCTREEAKRWLDEDLAAHGEELQSFMTREPTQNQYDAFLSLAFNCGAVQVGGSGTMRRFNAGEDQACADRFLLWINDNGKPVPGLKARRAAEHAMYLYGSYGGRP